MKNRHEGRRAGLEWWETLFRKLFFSQFLKKIIIWTIVVAVDIKMDFNCILEVELVCVFDDLVVKEKKVSTKYNGKFRKILYYLEKLFNFIIKMTIQIHGDV